MDYLMPGAAFSELGPVAAAVVSGLGSLTVLAGLFMRTLRKDTSEERVRLRSTILGDSESRVINVNGDLRVGSDGSVPGVKAGEQRVDDDRFAELLIEYYAWGLTQARLSTALSLSCSALGIAVLLGGVVVGLWKSETTGDLYLSAVAGIAGLVAAIIGQLAHRRADTAMRHMQRQTEDLRQDMKRERETETAIRLVSEVDSPELKAELQAALILRLSGATLTEVRERGVVPLERIPSQSASPNGAPAG
ncbi:TRADD-N-associated membrane domain-containing protein [Streptomyces jumonjinensis]|uniref:Cyanobacterial TRADD-N associated 2 transmembrane domain-containing protein n=1 Tax=Streptomyces jumonjinensis TaxID=1945 RepID=A0A646KAU5_STRJU|nr:hypothetical protein [Streptomyces jumonjinensis]MQS99334.1 hypothetical protein [Streptomyces jumonjinensis]